MTKYQNISHIYYYTIYYAYIPYHDNVFFYFLVLLMFLICHTNPFNSHNLGLNCQLTISNSNTQKWTKTCDRAFCFFRDKLWKQHPYWMMSILLIIQSKMNILIFSKHYYMLVLTINISFYLTLQLKTLNAHTM